MTAVETDAWYSNNPSVQRSRMNIMLSQRIKLVFRSAGNGDNFFVCKTYCQ